MKTLEQILANANRDILPAIVVRTQEIKRLHNLFRGFLSTDLVKHCQLAKIDDGVLHVVVDGAVWGARLRYAIPDILKNLKLQPEFKDVDKIQYHINVEAEAPSRKIKKNEISETNSQLWRRTIAELKHHKTG